MWCSSPPSIRKNYKWLYFSLVWTKTVSGLTSWISFLVLFAITLELLRVPTKNNSVFVKGSVKWIRVESRTFSLYYKIKFYEKCEENVFINLQTN